MVFTFSSLSLRARAVTIKAFGGRPALSGSIATGYNNEIYLKTYTGSADITISIGLKVVYVKLVRLLLAPNYILKRIFRATELIKTV